MSTLPDTDAVRAQALACLQAFSERYLPGTIRRLCTWKRLPRGARPELLADVRQELAVDCLQHAAAIVAATTAERHLRWMRLADHFVHRQFAAPARGAAEARQAAAAAEAPDDGELPTLVDVRFLRNGRLNLRETADCRGVHERTLRRELATLAERLGAGREHHAFWCQRLAEALTGLAADLLRERGLVLLWPRPRQPPDPAARLRRLRRLVGHFPIRAATLPQRAILRRWLLRSALDDAAPRRLLADARAVAPPTAAVWLWTFEADLAAGELGAAGRALRAARSCPRPPAAAIALARARLLEARGRWPAACRSLRRAAARWPRCEPLAALAAALGDGAA